MATNHGKRLGGTKYRVKMKGPVSSGGHIARKRRVWYEQGVGKDTVKVPGPLPTPRCAIGGGG